MKINKMISLDIETGKILEKKGNVSAYINELILREEERIKIREEISKTSLGEVIAETDEEIKKREEEEKQDVLYMEKNEAEIRREMEEIFSEMLENEKGWREKYLNLKQRMETQKGKNMLHTLWLSLWKKNRITAKTEDDTIKIGMEG